MLVARSSTLLVAVAIVALGGCNRSEPTPSGRGAPPTPAPPRAPAPTPAGPAANEPLAPLPAVGSLDRNKVTLGRRLYHDTQLSGDNTLSCASCHSLDRGGVDPQVVRTSTGIRGQIGPINAPTVLNSRFNFVQFWDGRAPDLTAQAGGPVTNPKEMGATWAQVLPRLGADTTYVAAFRAAYADGITQQNVQDAIATYEMTLVTPSRFDRWLGGDTTALTTVERQGYATFKEVGCTACHNGVNAGGGMFQRMGLVRDYFADRGALTDADNGRFNVTHQPADRHFFKVPTLRNVEHTAPYFHDGSRATLEEAVQSMGRYQLGRELDAGQVRVIVAFLRSLSGEIPADARLPAT